MSQEKAQEKKPATPSDSHSKASSAPPSKAGKGHAPMPDGCHSWGCKSSAKRFNFCNEHYDHFKFGLIKKTGEPVMDYDKKFEHYTAYLKKRGAQRVA